MWTSWSAQSARLFMIFFFVFHSGSVRMFAGGFWCWAHVLWLPVLAYGRGMTLRGLNITQLQPAGLFRRPPTGIDLNMNEAMNSDKKCKIKSEWIGGAMKAQLCSAVVWSDWLSVKARRAPGWQAKAENGSGGGCIITNANLICMVPPLHPPPTPPKPPLKSSLHWRCAVGALPAVLLCSRLNFRLW